MPETSVTGRHKVAVEEENVYTGVYYVLLVGMIVSSVMFALGIVMALWHRQFVPLAPEWVQQHYHWNVVIHGLMNLDPMVLMMVATVLLILTPVARVLVSIYGFAVDKDYKFVAVTGIVFLVMAASVVLGLLGLK